MKESFLKDLLKQIITKEDLIILLEEINLTENFIFKNISTPLSEKLKGKTREEFRGLVEKLEKENSLFVLQVNNFLFFKTSKKILKRYLNLNWNLLLKRLENFL